MPSPRSRNTRVPVLLDRSAHVPPRPRFPPPAAASQPRPSVTAPMGLKPLERNSHRGRTHTAVRDIGAREGEEPQDLDLWLERQGMAVLSTKREACGTGLGWLFPGKR